MIRSFAAALALASLTACASTPAGDDLAAFPASLVGSYTNGAQYAQAPEDMKRAPRSDDAYDWIDRQNASFRAVSVPAIGAHVIYAEWRGEQGISRQNLWSFRRDGNQIVLDIYSLAAPAAARVATDPAAFAALSAADMNNADPACALAVSSSGRGAWNAQSDPETCHIVLPAGAVAVDTRITVMPTGVLFQTSGRLPNGTFVFRTPGGPPYDFRRVP